ncbi:DUF739 family protein [Helcococcus bovis]|uniref:DUF739 family protein n=1 Tax=Helcococcus bovis TaxID=3153252 RepID=UPI0038B6C46A
MTKKEKIKYNYNKLRGLIKEHFGSNEKFAEYIGISEQSLYSRLNGEVYFRQDEIEKTLIGLNQSPANIDNIFFVK